MTTNTAGIQKPERKIILDAIKQAGLDPTEFEERLVTPQILKIVYKNSRLFFKFEMNPTSYTSFQFSLVHNIPNRQEVEVRNGWLSLDTVIKDFNIWLHQEVKKWKDAQEVPDPGEEYNNTFFNKQYELDDEGFTQSEKEKIKNILTSDFRTTVIGKFQLSAEQIKLLDAKIDRLVLNMDTQNKLDWQMFAFGVLASIITGLSLDREQGVALYHEFIEAIRYIKPFLLTAPPL